jgi:hypothetical protein
LGKTITILLILCTGSLLQAGQATPTRPLRDVKEIQVLPTVIKYPEKVKDPDAAATVEKSLRRALLVNEYQLVESAPVKARISLDEFSRGNQAKRILLGLGAGRSTVDCRIQLLDENENEIASVRVRVRGDISWSPYQGNTTQTKQALNKFERALTDEIDKWK